MTREANGREEPGKAPPPEMQVLDPLRSRNRYFDWYEHGEGKRVLPFRRILQGFLADLKHAGNMPIRYAPSRDGNRVWLELTIPRFRSTRRAWLHPKEFAALRQHPELGERLIKSEETLGEDLEG